MKFLEYIEFIHKNNVDAVLIQDLGMFGNIFLQVTVIDGSWCY